MSRVVGGLGLLALRTRSGDERQALFASTRSSSDTTLRRSVSDLLNDNLPPTLRDFLASLELVSLSRRRSRGEVGMLIRFAFSRSSSSEEMLRISVSDLLRLWFVLKSNLDNLLCGSGLEIPTLRSRGGERFKRCVTSAVDMYDN